MAHPNHPEASGEAALHGHQPDQVEIGTIVWFGVGLTLSVMAVFAVVWFLLMYFRGRDIRTAEEQSPLMAIQDGLFPAPRLQEHPPRNLAAYHLEMEKKTESFGWVDEKAGIARIPVERALEIAAEKGLPTPRPAASKVEPAAEPAKVEQPSAAGAQP